MLICISQCQCDHREKRAGADNQRGIGGGGEQHGGILTQKIQRPAGQSQSRHHQFVLPVVAQPGKWLPGQATLVPLEQQQENIGDDEAQCEDMGRRQAGLQQQLGKHKCASPNGHNDKGCQMIEQTMIG